MAFLKEVNKFLFGKPEKFQQKSLLTKPQQGLESQLQRAVAKPGGAGGFGEAADYYRNLISGEGLPNWEEQDFNALQAPQLRQFNEQIIPDLAEQFAGMGSGGLSSSGFRNAAIGAGTDLSERLAAMRANLRQNTMNQRLQAGLSGAQGLQNLSQTALNPTAATIHRPETTGVLQDFASGAAKGVGAAIPGLLGL